MNSVTCLSWVKRGVAKSHPEKVKLTEDKLRELIEGQESRLNHLSLDDESDSGDENDNAEVDENEPGHSNPSGGESRKRKHDESTSNKKEPKKDFDIDEITKKYGLEDYEDSDKDDEEHNPLNIEGLATYTNNKEDPYLAKDVESDEEDEDMEIIPDDNLIAIGRVHGGDYCNLEIYLYNESNNDLYCHHDLLLPSFPLAIEWLNYDPGEEELGNFVAVGSMQPNIEIWDLDIVDALEPIYVLAGSKKKKKDKKKKRGGHTDAVLDLAWNQLQRKVLASASADFSVGIWDLEQGAMATAITHHTEKVQTIEWHPFEPQSLLSGSFDQTVKVYDCRSPDESHKSWTLDGEVERVLWNLHDPYFFLASTDQGSVHCLDVRTTDKVFTLKAHDAAVTGLAISSSQPGCLLTTSSDKTVKAWDITGNKPSHILTKDLKAGQLHCVGSCPESPFVFAAGGESELKIVNLKKFSKIRKHFGLEGADDEDDEEEVDMGAGAEDDSEAETEKKDEAEEKKKKKKKKKKSKKPANSESASAE